MTISNAVSYLGLVLSCIGKFSQTQSNLADRGLKAVYKLFNETHELYAPDPNLLCSLFDKLVQPVVLYGSKVWGFHSALDVEHEHLSFCKRVLHVKRSTAYYYIWRELGRFPLQIISKIQKLKYWINIITGMSNPLVKRAYDIEYEMCEKSPSFSSWTMSLKSLLYNLGLFCLG